jgi:hypothetical protein
VLHQTVIVGVAYLVVGWDLPVWQRFTAICLAGSALTVVLYEVVVRRFNPVRFLFGMKPLRPTMAWAGALPAPADSRMRAGRP